MKIKPCPFCATPKVFIRTQVDQPDAECQVYCPKCGTHGPAFHNPNWAIQGWNQLPRNKEERHEATNHVPSR